MISDHDSLNMVKIVLERDDYKIENSGYNLYINDTDIILEQYPGTRVLYKKNLWNHVKIKYKRKK